ncbi:hypothetical protein LTR56_025731 [Elasticomyces elasticus]|nr:hypothetical protein LTR56_025731 [Elasticomyces elasticus]KAK3653062.1 hypothetical protein LTR22_011299 [Elasticomyces elasticus]KAK4919695.1 hypothetical protein LTR49_012760 [Elasticomyces elasticus]KAK5749146.1 hypothetical protein LTS12_020768 [Elasticomyces elasticus]
MAARERSTRFDSRRQEKRSQYSSLTIRQSGTLPRQLQTIVPTCAQTCLNGYIKQQYAACSSDDNLDCLCSKYSSQGYTLGELAYICLQKDCPPASQAKQQSVYGVCSAETSKVAATHSTLTLPASATVSPGVTTTTLEVYITSSAFTPSPSSEATSRTTLQTPALPRTGSTTTTSTQTAAPATPITASSTPTIPAAVGTSTGSTNLTSGQAVGVSVAAFGGLALIVALIWLFSCLRRRKGKGICKSPSSKHDSYDFIDEAPPRFSPFNYGYADPRGPLGGSVGRRAELPDEKRAKTQWYREHFPAQQPSGNFDALGLKVNRTVSPESIRSQRSNGTLRTVSQLLPDKPGETPPIPFHTKFVPPPPSVKSPETVFEEYRHSRPTSKRMSANLMPPVPTHATLLRTKGAMPGTQHAKQDTTPPTEVRHPSLSLTMPMKASRAAMKVPSPIAVVPPPIPRTSSADRTSRGSRAKSGTSSKSGGSLLDYYASPTADLSMNPLGSPFTPISLEPQRRVKPVPTAITVTKPTYPPRAVRRVSSAGSDTSFESTDPDEPTPPDEADKQLSPVAEHSPIAAIRYPKVPRSSNQSIPRSPQMKSGPMKSPRRHRQRREEPKDDRRILPSLTPIKTSEYVTPERQITSSPSLTGSTLAAKRSNNTASPSTEKRLFIDTSHSRANSHVRSQSRPQDITAITPPRLSANGTRQESPLKGYGRVASAGGRYHKSASKNDISTPEMKSPAPTVVRYTADGEAYQTALKSPLWEPKLTPRRRGDDLFLEVGLASPGMASPGLLTPGPLSARR